MRRLLHDKKGQNSGDAHLIGRKIFFYIFLLMIVGLLMVFFVVFIDKANVARTTISEGSRADFVLARLTNTCFATTDPATGETIQNTLDYSLITSQRLSECFLASYPPALTVRVKPITQGAFPQATAQLNNGGFSEDEFVRYTLVKYNGKTVPAQIYVKV